MAAIKAVHLTPNNIIGFFLLKVAVICFLIVCGSYGTSDRHSRHHWNSHKTNPKNKVLFPFDYEAKSHLRKDDYRSEFHRILNSVSACQNTTFCEQPPYYPDGLINLAVEMDDKFKYSAVVDKVIDPDTESRIDMIDKVPICSSIIQIVYPKTAVNSDSRWMFIINHSNFVQGVRVEMCRGGSNYMLNGTPAGYDTFCEQRYTYRQLATILPNGTIKLDTFRFPSECRGYIKLSDLENRIDQPERKVIQI